MNVWYGGWEQVLFTGMHVFALQVVQRLLKAGADPKLTASSGMTPLHEAAFIGSGEITQLLLTAGADSRAMSSGKVSPLHFAAKRNSVEVAKLLLASGADLNVGTASGTTPLAQAANSGPPPPPPLEPPCRLAVSNFFGGSGPTKLAGLKGLQYA